MRDTRKLDGNSCQPKKEIGTLVFTVIENDATALAVEDDIRNNLAELGIKVETKLLSKDDWNNAQVAGDFHLSFTESWGAPYDPHSYGLGWDGSGGEGHFQAFSSFDKPSSRNELFNLIKDVMKEEDHKKRRSKWEKIHNYYHSQAVMLPLWGKRIPTLMNSRLSGYQAGHQQFDYPVHKLVPITGPSTITIAPGAQTGLFQTVGRLDPHTYRPNEFFANNWVYEGLVAYGDGGQTLPALAKSWIRVDREDSEGEKITFKLRDNVTFHDGEEWNCNACKMNFDHVFAGNLKTDMHNWYGVPLHIDKWSCEDTMTFVVTTKTKYAPFIQELSYIRPLRMLSPGAFANGTDSSANTTNSCHIGWGTIGSETNPEDVVCAGISKISGTGPLKFVERKNVTIDGKDVDSEVIFSSNYKYWGGEPFFQTLKVVRYETSNDAKAALLDNKLDVIWGSGVLSDKDIAAIQDNYEYEGKIQVFHSKDIQNVMLLLNSGKAPLNDINVRKTLIHAIDKSTIVEKELSSLQKVVDNVFPRDAPYCDVDLTPRWDYDIEKAKLLFCKNESNDSNDSKSLAIGLGVGLCALFLLAVATVFSINKRRVNAEAELELLRQKDAVQA